MTVLEELKQTSFIPGPILLLGAPGVGKGTQAQALMDAWGVPQVSTGDIVRENIRHGTSAGRQVQDLVARGHLVPDELVNDMVARRTTQSDCARGFILDGYPRTLVQAEWWDRYEESQEGPTRSASALPVVAVSIEVRYDELLRRITGRRTGPISRRIYNIYSNPPLTQGVCDVDGAPLVQRPDDTEVIFVERMRAFDQLTSPVIEHYRRVGRFEVVDGEQAVEQVTESIAAALKRLRRGVQ